MSKLIVDAALSKNSRMASVAAVARDGGGVFLGASAVVMLGTSDPETMEVLELREGLALANDLSLSRVRMASDCANAVRSMAGSTSGVYGQIVKKIKDGAADFQMMEIVHERREANSDAHTLARCTLLSSTGRHVWFCVPPDGICNSYVNI
jgi:ribonuclease HI